MRRVLVTGGAGLLGGELVRSAPAGVEVHATQRRAPVESANGRAEVHQADLADAVAVLELFGRVRPDVVIHTAYGTEDPERDILRATQSVVAGCRAVEAGLVHVSTDVVFDGERAPYAEGDELAPVHEYGRWKAEAERVVREVDDAAVVRTSLIVRADPPDRVSAGVLDALRRGEPVRLFVDELRCPIAVEDLAAQLWELTALPAEERAGPWHLAGPEAVSRFALGLLLARRHGLDASKIVPALNASSPTPPPRDQRLLTTRADRTLATRARATSAVLG